MKIFKIYVPFLILLIITITEYITRDYDAEFGGMMIYNFTLEFPVGDKILIILGFAFMTIVAFIYALQTHYLIWKNDYYRDKDLFMKKEKLLHRIFRCLD